MLKNSVIFTTLSVSVATLFISLPVFAGDIEWGGLYRIEGYQIHNSELRNSNKKSLDYALSHLVLRPKITAGDGITIYGQFDIFNSGLYPNTQMGQVWGNGVNNPSNPQNTSNPSAGNSNTLSHTQAADTLAVSELYMTFSQEFGQLIVGRAPLQFGLGMTHNAGRGLFDHFYDTRDMVGYKVIMGNISFMPMIGKPSGGHINQSDDLDDFMAQVEYENPETDLQMGVFYQWRKGGDQAADAPVGVGTAPGQVLGGPGASNANVPCSNPANCSTSQVNTKTVNVYVLRDTERFRAGMEASFMSGDSGVVDAGGNKVDWGGIGIAAEFEYRPESSKWKWGLKTGFASGDDPTTTAKFEGYTFNRNYDVAMLMFNHPLGQADILRTGVVTGNIYDTTATNAGQKNISQADVETISNAIYFAPVAKVAFNDHWSLDNTLITGWLSTNPMPGQQGKALGYEYDVALNFTPRKGVQWINQAGLLFPDQAWKGDGSAGYTNNFAFGIGTKAAISF